MEENKYFSVPGLSKSQIKYWDSHNPTKFWDICTFNPNRKKVEPNDAMVQGQLYHAFLWERDKVLDMFEVHDDLGKMRSNKKWTEAQKNTKKTIITTEELNHGTRLVDALLKHQVIRDLIDAGTNEKEYFWHDKAWDIDCKAKLDCIKNTTEGIYVIDYKSTSQMDKMQFIDKGGFQYDVGFYARAVMAKYGLPLVKFFFIFQSTKDGEENDIRIKVVEGAHLEACAIATDCAVREIVPKIKEYLAKPEEKIWLPDIKPEPFEISPWYDREMANKINKGE